MKNIVSFSGGKDSTAMLLMMVEQGIPIDEIVFCDTEKEFPQMYDHIQKVQEYIGREVTVLREPGKFDYLMFDHVKTRGKNKGKKGYGWPDMRCRWCTSKLKADVFKKYIKQKHGKDYVKFIGIAYDEPERWQKQTILNEVIAMPLVNWQITEGMALKYCYDHGFDWGGLYTHFDRVSCWCCPMSNQKELFMLYHLYPKLWEQLKDMDSRSWNQFKRDYSVLELEEKFRKMKPVMQVSLF
jgi:3'-phosphoadenosine 5'-phosphosulfate sulfotransferase (PAPS reductase)/FAD synthetase